MCLFFCILFLLNTVFLSSSLPLALAERIRLEHSLLRGASGTLLHGELLRRRATDSRSSWTAKRLTARDVFFSGRGNRPVGREVGSRERSLLLMDAG